MDIADKIKYLQNNLLDISQEEFARKVKVTRSSVSKWEDGTSKPTTSHLVMISRLCNVTTDYLIFDNHPYELALYEIDDEEYNLLNHLIEFYEKRK